MINAKLLILFFDVYRMHCDGESLPENSGDAALYITESYDAVRTYALDCINNEKEMTAKCIVKLVTDSIFDIMTDDSDEKTDECIKSVAAFIADLMKTFDKYNYV